MQDCGFSYKNVNVNNIKAAFEHFSNVVVSDFDPLGDEAKLEIYYNELRQSEIYTEHFGNFSRYENKELDISAIMEIENGCADFIKNKKKEAKDLKTAINKYFKILNLIEFVIDLEEKFSEKYFYSSGEGSTMNTITSISRMKL